MIREVHRPKTVEEALALLSRQGMATVAMGGGTVLNRPSSEAFAVVDLQDLALDQVEVKGHVLSLGATVKLAALLESPDLPQALAQVIRLEATYNLRQAATLAGAVLSADGRSPLATALLALDAVLDVAQSGAAIEQIGLGDLLPLRGEKLRGRLVTRLMLPLNARLAYESVRRTPADLPIVGAAAACWPSGRTRLALGGFGPAPILALDGPEAQGAEDAARSAYSDAGDEWASAEYRREMAQVLTRRCLQGLELT
jgi:putative selenate reductase FAD-binding subunit